MYDAIERDTHAEDWVGKLSATVEIWELHGSFLSMRGEKVARSKQNHPTYGCDKLTLVDGPATRDKHSPPPQLKFTDFFPIAGFSVNRNHCSRC